MNWRLTRNAIGEPEVQDRYEDDEDLTRGFSLLRELARSDETMVEVAPGMWRITKPTPGRES